MVEPKAGFCFPDFETGDCLYVTGTTEILIGKDAADVLPRSNLAVRVTVTSARLVASVLPFRGKTGEFSPYNPIVRHLVSEKVSAQVDSASQNQITAKLLEQKPLTPTISRFRFSLSNATTYTAGQYVTIDASEHLDVGYSHMRDDDPRSLNDDFVRTFTVSSPPGLPPHPTKRLADDEFEITIRKVGVVTDFLFKHGLGDSRMGTNLEVGIKGFGGSFEVKQDRAAPVVGFVAAGVGITPLMPCLSSLNQGSLRLCWTLRMADVGVAADLLSQHPELARSLTLFITGTASDTDAEKKAHEELKVSGCIIQYRRMEKKDLDGLMPDVKRWYICTATIQRSVILGWLQGQEVLYEDYNF